MNDHEVDRGWSSSLPEADVSRAGRDLVSIGPQQVGLLNQLYRRAEKLLSLTGNRRGYYYKNCYSTVLLGISPVVGRLTLAQEAQVRPLYPQPKTPLMVSRANHAITLPPADLPFSRA